MTEEEGRSCRPLEDTRGKGSWPLDVPNPQGEGTFLQFLPEGGAFSIPMRCLFNSEVDNLVTAGRSLSASVKAHGAARIQATAMATGQAAGVLAVLMQQGNTSAADIDPSRVRKILKAWGAVV